MNTLADFLVAVAADLDDVATRLVCADWAETQGFDWLAKMQRRAAEWLRRPGWNYYVCRTGGHPWGRHSHGLALGCCQELIDGKRCPACGCFKGHTWNCRLGF